MTVTQQATAAAGESGNVDPPLEALEEEVCKPFRYGIRLRDGHGHGRHGYAKPWQWMIHWTRPPSRLAFDLSMVISGTQSEYGRGGDGQWNS